MNAAGLYFCSLPIEVWPSCPGKTVVSDGNTRSFSAILSTISRSEPVVKSYRTKDSHNIVSPLKSTGYNFGSDSPSA